MKSLISRLKNNNIIKGAFIISVGGLTAKILGALYRIPLTNILGSNGIGLYQMAFPVYCILLTFSSTGLPSGMAKLIAGGYDGKYTLKRSLKLFSAIGLVGTVLMLVFSYQIARLQGEISAGICYVALSPSVFLVSVLSCFRGYFQGQSNMAPTSVSQVTEQTVKLLFGLSLCYVFRNNIVMGAGLACLAVSSSEAVACLYIFSVYRKKRRAIIPEGKKITELKLIKTVFPITLSAVMLPLAKVADSFLIVNFLKTYLNNATSLYGIYTGGVESVTGVAVAVCYGVAVAILPETSRLVAKNNFSEAEKKIRFSLLLTFGISVITAVLTFLFARPAVNFLYRGLSVENRNVMALLLKTAAVSIVFLSLTQTGASCLIAYGKLYTPCIGLGIGIILKTVFLVLTLKIPDINIFAAAISDILCYIVACFFNLVYIIIIARRRKAEYENNVDRLGSK